MQQSSRGVSIDAHSCRGWPPVGAHGSMRQLSHWKPGAGMRVAVLGARIAVVLIGLLAALAIAPHAARANDAPAFEPAALAADIDVLRAAYGALHPSLTRYRSEGEIEDIFDRLAKRWSKPRTRRQAFLDLSETLAAIQCGHTYANFYNQSAEVKAALFDNANKPPFTFRIIGDRMIVDRDVSGLEMAPGTQIVRINGVRPATAFKALARYIKSDGARPAPRRHAMQLTGADEIEPFDVFFPLLYPPADGVYALRTRTPDGKRRDLSAPALARGERRARLLGARKGAQSAPMRYTTIERDGLRVAHLTLETFAYFNSSFDWRGFLDASFARIAEENVRHVILDVRGNSGGEGAVLQAVIGAVSKADAPMPPQRQEIAALKTPDALRAHLGTWDPSFYDWTGRATPLPNGRYALAEGVDRPAVTPGDPDAYDGELVLLVDEANSSATFTLAQVMKATGRATLIGSETGGNRRGVTGGAILFLTLPNTKLEGDIPLIRYEPTGLEPDAGVAPDIEVKTSLEDVIAERDAPLEAALAHFASAPRR